MVPVSIASPSTGHAHSDLDAVLALAGRGLHIFPVQSRGKTPLLFQWPTASTCDAETIKGWVREYPHCNWGLVCGPKSGVFVLDVDGEEGVAAIRHLCALHGEEWLHTLTVLTARGRHLYFQYPPVAVIRNSASKLASGLDIRGDGGYVLLPPSIHPTGAAYVWGDGGESGIVAQPPSWLLEMLCTSAQPTREPVRNAGTFTEGTRNATLTSLAGTMQRRGMSVEAIKAALLQENTESCKPPLSEVEVVGIVASISRYAPGQGTTAAQPGVILTLADWPEPEPLRAELPAVQSFDTAMLPEVLRVFVEDTAERMQVPLDFPAAVCVLALAGATNRRATIQPKAVDKSWVVIPNLWGAIVAPPGLMKSPVITAVTRPLTQTEALWRTEYQSAMSNYRLQKEEVELQQAVWRGEYKAAQKAGKEAPVRPDSSIPEPVVKRLITQDATAEKLHEMLRDNPAGVLLIRDELSAWLATLDKPGREGERGFFLSAWNGDTSYTMDRIGRGSIHVDACCVSLLGGIQPARLRGYLAEAMKDGPSNDGLFQRLQVLVYPDVSGSWKYVDRLPRADAMSEVSRLFERITRLDAAEPLKFRFSPDAQELFIAFLGELEGKVRSREIHPALQAHLAKFRKLMPSLALLFELADEGVQTVSLGHARQAAACCDYFESHARRVYSMIVSAERQGAAELGRHLAQGWKSSEGVFSVRDVYQNDWRGLENPDKVRLALAVLEDAGWIRSCPAESNSVGGRRSERYAINPKVRGAK